MSKLVSVALCQDRNLLQLLQLVFVWLCNHHLWLFPWQWRTIQIFVKLWHTQLIFIHRTCKKCNKKVGSPCLFSRRMPSKLCADQIETSTTPPGKPRAFDYLLCPGSGKFDCGLRGVGKIEPEVSGFKWFFFRAPKTLKAIKHVFGRDGRV